MRVALFGGSFDPPHLGHLAIALAAAEHFALDQVLFAPTGRQPLKPTGANASFADRFAMVELLCRADSRFSASTMEGPRSDGAPNFMIDTLRRLRDRLPAGTQLFSVAGADSFLDLRRWREPDALLEAAEWIVVSRPGFSLSSLQSLALTTPQQEQVHLLEGVEVPVSATEIRSFLHTGKDCEHLLPHAVHTYIQAHHLYTITPASA